LKTPVFSLEDTTLEERNEDEVLKRLKEKKFYNNMTGRQIKKPIILKTIIKDLKGGIKKE